MRGGDTLAGIAQQLWGDAGLWYKLADANGLTAGTALAAGQSLRLPAGVLRSAHSDATLTPYDHAGAIGDIQPTTPQPPAPRASSHGKKHCGGFGTVLLAVVAVAVTVATAGAAVAALSPTIGSVGAGIGAFLGLGGATTGLGAAALVGVGAAAGAAGSIASQAVGVATGIQEKFSWKGVALAGISGGVGGGLGAALPGGGVGTAALRGALGNAATQGVALATGLQRKFDWAGVAAGGAGGAAGGWVGGRLGGSFGAGLAAGAASALAGAATRSALDGSSFGDNLLRAIPDTIGQAVGNALARSLATKPGAQSAPAIDKAAANPVAQANGTVGANAEAAAQDGLEPVGEGIVITAQRSSATDVVALGAYYRSLSETDRLNFDSEHGLLRPSRTPMAQAASGRQFVAGHGDIPGGFEDPSGNLFHDTIRYILNNETADDVLPWLIDSYAWGDASEAGAAQLANRFLGEAASPWQLRVGTGLLMNLADGPHGDFAVDVASQLQTAVNADRAAFQRDWNQSGRDFANAYIDAAAYVSPLAAGAQSLRDYDAGAITAGQAVTNMLPGRVGKLARVGRALGDPQAALPRVRLSAETRRQMGPVPPGMRGAHAHHILDLNGRPGAHRALVREGQDILRAYDIDPLHGAENLTWAPNRGHTLENTRAVVERLREAQRTGKGRGDIVDILRLQGRIAAGR